MSFNFGQFRRDQLAIENYISLLENYEIQNYQSTTGTVIQQKFVDKMIVLNASMDNSKTYYLQVEINKMTSRQDFSLILKSSTNNEINQIIDTFYVNHEQTPQGTEIFEFIITPNMGYDRILFSLLRNTDDYQLNNGDDTYGRKPVINILTLGEVKDLLNSPIGHSPLTKIGVYGSVGMLMIINGEPIRIGPNGVYEINNGYKIKTFGVVIKDNNLSTDNKEYFILDYQY